MAKATPGLTDEARRRGARTRAENGLFNRYVRRLQRPRLARIRRQIAEIDALLGKGTRPRSAPVFEGGKRVGTTTKELPLLPSERALEMVRRAELEALLHARIPADLRQQFLAMLPEYARRNGMTRDILLAVGVPARDLDAAGLR